MLDQPVPNPLAKNPNVHTHKVFASVGLILLGTIIILAILAYFYRDQVAYLFVQNTGKDNTVQTTKVSTSSAKKSTESAKKDETADWKSLTSRFGTYSIDYPASWVAKEGEGPDAVISKDENVYPLYTMTTSNDSSYNLAFQQKAIRDYQWKNTPKEENTTLSGKEAWKISGNLDYNSVGNSYTDLTAVIYVVKVSDTGTILISYRDDSSETNKATFDEMVSSFKVL